MLAAERRSRLLAEVRRRGAAAVPDLAETLGVSEMTIRRDLDVLAADGRVDKVRGGARTPQPGVAASRDFATQSRRNGDGKRAIARRAAELVEPGMSVGLSGGSTTWALARELRGIDDLTIVTNSLPVADVFARPDRADEPYTQTVVLTGGVRTPADALVGAVAVASLEHLHCDIVFLGVRGMDLTAGLTTSNLLEAETNRALVAAGGRAVVLADHTKWGAVGLTTIVDLHEVDLVVTDEGLAPDAEETLRAHVTELWVAAHGDD
ncbi:DeoR/GlpR family DNA-binding transcription regulator [uncultured Microbacterium sp.]|uniref:DeoR/GlpR family DNA-binding transcription regulator n=1 Tax=uncultured Microbacterium sp. TaxID=191216 RepID=UPI0025F88435|nr:DeoR/GlpR family DNA-binding transcription regulator [uncultured Microbacterium sp.]